MEKSHKKYILYTWIVVIVLIWSLYLLYPETFSQKSLSAFLIQFNHFVIIIYLLIFTLRGFTLIPSTVLILAGAAIFDPILLIILASIWSLTSSSVVYFFSDFLWITKDVKKKFGKKKIKSYYKKLNQHGFSYVAIWSAIPFVPTDLMCSIAWMSKMSYTQFWLWIFTWSLPLIVAYAYLWESLLSNIF